MFYGRFSRNGWRRFCDVLTRAAHLRAVAHGRWRVTQPRAAKQYSAILFVLCWAVLHVVVQLDLYGLVARVYKRPLYFGLV